jgi:hypothetical protein
MVGGLCVLVALVAFAPSQVERLSALRADIAARDRVGDDLRALVERPAVAAALAGCRPLYVPNHRNVPNLRRQADLAAGDVVSAQLERPGSRGLFLAPANARVEQLSILDPNDPSPLDAAAPPSYRPVARNASWVLLSGC